MRSVSFLPAARDEFLAQVEYYEAELPGLGVRFATAVEAATSRVLAYPMAGHSLVSGTRRVLTHDFPFSVVYRPIDEGIRIRREALTRIVGGSTVHEVFGSRETCRP